MTDTTTEYVLGRSDAEYERLRSQARTWEPETARLLDRIGLRRGARCLDAGCGPGETMRLLAQRVGPEGHVVGVDVDAAVGARAERMLHDAGHEQCAFTAADLATGTPVPGAPFDLVYARLLLFHVAEPAEVLRRLWALVAPGGHLVVQDYDLRTVAGSPALATVAEWNRVVPEAMRRAGCDVHMGLRLPELFAAAAGGRPDGTDVAGRLEPLRAAGPMLRAVFLSVLPAAVAMGLLSEDDGNRWLDDLDRDLRERPECSALWPLLIGAWKHKPSTDERKEHR